MEMGGGGELPEWLSRLVEEKFFGGCETHKGMKKNEKNVFCLRCCATICHHCAPAHPSHPLLQVRRYVYNNVVRLDDLKQFIDCSFVQAYTINSAKVIFLKPRPQSRVLLKSSGNICLRCDRVLQEPFSYCCLTCKVEHVVMQGLDISSILLRFDESELAFSLFESLRMDGSDLPDDEGFDHNQISPPNPVLKDSMQWKGSSSGSSANEKSDGSDKNDGHNFLPGITFSHSRRKGAPHRSPLS